ncbi:MAG: TonB-dependent receptor [Tannerella sp.]|jgi:TonB-linked SusC/RagA family outer membrane protein|nr:TonB-dependent receptor [Tannerella sp.]
MNLKAFIYCNARSSGAKRKRPWNFFILLLLASVFSTVAAAGGNAEEETGTSAVPSSETLQQNGIAGYVYDETGEPVPGASVAVKGTQTGTVTDGQGRFVLSVAAGTELEISFIGYVTQTVRAAANMRVTLQEDTQQIEEVVVIGYGTVRKSDLTGSLVSISSEKFKNLPQGGVTQILQGKAAGVNITSTSGAGNTNIRIRGITSLNKSSEPLWVVDGVIGGTVGNFYDIQSIEVLKDASSTAIYGSQGANGVILVTTKKAQEGKARVTFDARYGWQTMRKKPDLLSPYEYAVALRDVQGMNAVTDEDFAAYRAGTKGIDWIDLMTQTGFGQNYNLNISGGGASTKYGITAWGGDSRSQIITGTSRNYNLKATLDTEITSWLNLSGYVYGSRSSSHNGADQSAFTDIVAYAPTMELQREDGVYNLDPYGQLGNSPYGKKYASYSDGEANSMTGFTDLRIKFPVDGLTLSLQGLYSHSQSIGRGIQRTTLYPNAPNDASNTSDQSWSWRNINNLTYQKEFGVHRLTAMGVLELSKSEWSRIRGVARNFSNEDIIGYWALASGATQTAENDYSNSAMVSAFGRVVYSYKGKYSFTGTYRADAPSQFKNRYKWGYFPSAGVAWNVSEEDFMNKDLIQQLKLRATVGTTGNHGVGAYSTWANLTRDYSAYGTSTQFIGYWPATFSNPDLHWEKTAQYDIGLDLSILDQKVNITTDWYLKKTTDLLFLKDLPDYNGGGAIWTNQGAVDNRGWELTVNAFPVQTKDFSWETNFTGTYAKTIVKDLAGTERIIPDAGRGGANQGGLFALQVGKPVGTFYLQEFAGFDENGATLHYTPDGGVTTQNEVENKKILDQNSIPDWTFGWNNSLTYKNFDFNVFLRATGMFYRLNHSRFYESCMIGASRFISSREAYYLSWDHVADKSQAQFASLTNPNSQYVAGSTQWLENAQFLRCQNLTLGYLFPKKQVKFADVHLSFSVENLFVLTGYNGMDPETVSEIDYRGDDNISRYDLTFGLDDGSFPIPRTYTLILRFDF